MRAWIFWGVIVIRSVFISAVAFGTLLAHGQGVAQTPSSASAGRTSQAEMGRIVSVEGPEGSVIVVRGAQAYALLAGDVLFRGDRVITRSSGRVTLSSADCEKTLQPTASLIIDDEVCKAAPVMLADGDGIGELALIAAPPLVGATPATLTTLAVAGGTAAALNGGGSQSNLVQ